MFRTYVRLDEHGGPIGEPMTIENIRYLLPHISLPDDMTPEDARAINYGLVIVDEIPYLDSPYQTFEPLPYEMVGFNIFLRRYQIVPKPDVEIEEIRRRQWEDVRGRRNRLLLFSDWTQIPDAPIDEATRLLWQEYRVKLRDLPMDQADVDPTEIIWPEPPGGAKLL